MHIRLHDVTKIELARTFLGNGGNRTIRITSTDYRGVETSVEVEMYGDPSSADLLPKSADFVSFPKEDQAAPVAEMEAAE